MNAGNGISADYAKTVVAGKTLETRWVRAEPESATTIVLLHDALGSTAVWKDFPERLAEHTNSNVLVYSRYGHGESELLSDERTIDYIHYEGEVVLPALLDKFGISSPLLLGHSDGASMAITYAGKYHDRVSGLILMAPHVFVEDITVQGVIEAGVAYEDSDLKQKLSRYHRDPDGIFHAWHNMWIDPQFRDWSIESYLSSICCPALLIQGEHDGYGTVAQLEAIRSHVPESEMFLMQGCGHSPYREQPEATLDRIAQFISDLPGQNLAHHVHACRAGRSNPSAASSHRLCRSSYRPTAVREQQAEIVKRRRSNLQ
jgi:pimeloyl-ACP methyl ester carboxylesterase